MPVIGVDGAGARPAAGRGRTASAPALDELLPRADFVILTDAAHAGDRRLDESRAVPAHEAGGVFINIGRGMTTRLDDLVAALHAGEIAGAGAGRVREEPLPADHPLWTTPSVLITPHTAGYRPLSRRAALRDPERRIAAASRPASRCATSSTKQFGFRGAVALEEEFEQARLEVGPTVFDWLVEIIEIHCVDGEDQGRMELVLD